MDVIEGHAYLGGNRIAIDGKRFVRCKFDGCFLTYSGGSFVWEDCQILSPCSVEMLGSAAGAHDFLYQVGALKDSSQIVLSAGGISLFHEASDEKRRQ